MKFCSLSRMACLALVLAMACFQSGQTEETYLSPIALAFSPDTTTLYVCAYTANQLLMVSTASGNVTKTVDLPGPPSGVAVHPSGSPVFVTADVPEGRVYALGTDGSVLYELAVGHSPLSPVISPDGNMIYVCNRFDNTISIIDLRSRAQVACISVAREPVAAAITPDGKLLYVANHLPLGPADGDYIAAEVSVIDTEAKELSSRIALPSASFRSRLIPCCNIRSGSIALPNGSSSLRGICVSPDGAHVYVTHILSRYQLPTTQLERGWMNTNALTVIDAVAASLINTVLLDDVSRGAANPWGVACTADGKYICVAHAGTHEVSVIDRAALHDKLARVAAGEAVSSVSRAAEDVPNDLSFLVGLRNRIRLAGNGPRGMAIIGTTAYLTEYFSDSLAMVDIAAAVPRPQSLPLGPEKEISEERLGEIFFNDAALCFQEWQSCASCHPDGRVDGLNWDLLNDGIGNPKNTKNMLLSHATPPAMGLGVRDTAETAVRAGIKFIQFAVRPEEDARAIDVYLRALQPTPSPALENGARSEAAERGKVIFEQQGCAECHPAPLYTTLAAYDVGTGTGMDKDMPFDTPSLVEIWRTAPYLYDGRAATLLEVLTEHNPDEKHGRTAGLSEEQEDDLVAYMKSL